MRVQTFQVGDGLRLIGERGGPAGAACAILMHGGGQTRFSWVAAAQALIGAGYQVINFDARGHGESDWAGTGGYSLSRYADDLRRIVTGIDARFALIGASLGGLTALRAIGEGLRPNALVLVDIVPEPDKRGVRRIREFMLGRPEGYASLEEVADAVAAYNPHRKRPRDLEGLRRNVRKGEDGRYRWHWDPAFLGREIKVELAELAATLEDARAADAVPSLLIRGTESDVVGEAGLSKLRAILPGLEVTNVAGAGHMVAGDNNDVFNTALLNFLLRAFPLAASGKA